MDIAPDGRIFTAYKSGSIRVISASGQLLATPFFTAPTDTYRDRGMNNVILDPNFATNRFVYVFTLRLSR